jgi:hypothetical protein
MQQPKHARLDLPSFKLQHQIKPRPEYLRIPLWYCHYFLLPRFFANSLSTVEKDLSRLPSATRNSQVVAGDCPALGSVTLCLEPSLPTPTPRLFWARATHALTQPGPCCSIPSQLTAPGRQQPCTPHPTSTAIDRHPLINNNPSPATSTTVRVLRCGTVTTATMRQRASLDLIADDRGAPAALDNAEPDMEAARPPQEDSRTTSSTPSPRSASRTSRTCRSSTTNASRPSSVCRTRS